MQKITLEKENDKEIDTGQEKKEQDPNELIEQIKNEYGEAFSNVEIKGGAINLEMAEEVLSIIRGIEGNMYDSSQGNRYINFETETIPYSVLRRAGETEPARLIKNKRRLDFAQWGTTPTGSIKRGTSFVFRNKDYQPTKEEKTLLNEWTTKLVSSFFYPPNDPNPNLTKFIGSAYEDYFDLDDITFELRTDGLNNPVAIHIQDPILYKPVIKRQKYTNIIVGSETQDFFEEYEKIFNGKIKVDEPEIEPDYLLIYNNHRIAGVTRDRVAKHHFFTRSDFRRAQKGYSIVEQAVRMITYITNAIKMNASNFTNNRLPQGFFAFTGGGVNQMQLEKLKKVMYAYQNDSNSQSRFPIVGLNGEKSDVKWVGARGTSRDMEYHQFMTLLFSIFCQLSGTDPREVALGSYGDAVGSKSLFEEPTDGIVKESKDLGAKVFLQYFADCLNTPNTTGDNIFKRITDLDIKLQFDGFEVEDRSKKVEIDQKSLATDKSINNLLAEQDIEAQELMLGEQNVYDVVGIGNQSIFQAVLFNAQQKAQKDAQEQQQQQPGQIPGQGEDGQPAQPGQQPDQQKQGGLTDKDKQVLKMYGGEADMEGDLRGEYDKLNKNTDKKVDTEDQE